MRIKKIQLVLSVLLGLIAACSSTRNLAPVIDRAPVAKVPETSKELATPVVVARVPDSPGYYTVKKGDTLLRIALEHGQSYRDIVSWNNLANPNDIKVDQVLRVGVLDAGSGQAQTFSVEMASDEVKEAKSSAVPMPAASAIPNKIAPRGDKRRYSEAAMVELQKSDINIASLKVTNAKTSKPSVSVTAGNDDTVTWAWPAEGKVIATFDEGKSKGIDIAGKLGQKIFSAGAGKVMYAGSGIRGYGNLVIVKHTNNLLSAYAHNKTIIVKEGQTVTKGQMIAEMGNSDTDAVKLHFEIRQQGKPVDPSKFLPVEAAR